MADVFRDTALGVVLRYVTGNRVLLYPEEKPDFKLPEEWQQQLDRDDDEDLDEDLTDGANYEKNETPALSSPSMTDVENGAVGADKAATITTAGSSGSGSGSGSASGSNSAKGDDDTATAMTGATADEGPYDALRRASTASHSNSIRLHHTKSREETLPFTDERLAVDELHEVQKTQSVPTVPRRVRTRTRKPAGGETKSEKHPPGDAAAAQTAIIVDWYASDDPANPLNWSRTRRVGISTLLCVYTFVVYTSSAIYTTSEAGVMDTFGVGATKAALGLALFVLGYGVGPLIFSPLSEIPAIGRNPVYAVTMVMYVIISLPTALAYGNLAGGHSSGAFGGLLALRFFQGFFGSPCLASGGASLGDMFALLDLPFALVAWVSAAYCGPALGPLLSGFSVPVKGWRWSLLEILWASAPVCVLMLALLPETAAATILLRRAKRLRAVTGSDRFRAPSEVAAEEKAARDPRHGTRSKLAVTTDVVLDALIKPIEITLKDPAVLFVQIYTAIIYGIYYSFFEAFPLVYPGKYGMSSGELGLVFLCVLVACLLGVVAYCVYLGWYLNPRIRASGQFPVAESRLVPALGAAFGPTIGLFIFAWTADHAPQVPWIAPTIGITVYGASVFVVMQCIFVYIPLSYPQYAASLFAANDFFRSAFACGAVLFGRPLYMNLGVGRGTTVLAGLSTIGVLGIWLLYFYGARLRSMSKFALS
ncbi:benomyl methotrexate resistance protein [Niveomyces insectorum RCEF 264]|uniref:Benomyl methotrexate resistance protein n=1 Tax=Niveomyces insectorum RCEF 264 TaxID=1081102 RepID=A0A167Y7Y8_9HYPO|nr:benomyl methotrexate resistance protein [Niveomyces insectorum RCEF 264]